MCKQAQVTWLLQPTLSMPHIDESFASGLAARPNAIPARVYLRAGCYGCLDYDNGEHVLLSSRVKTVPKQEDGRRMSLPEISDESISQSIQKQGELLYTTI